MKRARQLLEITLPGLFYGGYLGEVVSLDDPDGLSRAEVRLLNFDGAEGHDGPVWARVACPFAGSNRGAFLLPDVGDEVFVVFVSGDPRMPVILGGLWNGDSTPPETISGGKNRRKVIRSKNGVKITMDDQDGQEQCVVETPAGQKVTLKDGPGAILIEDSNGNSAKLESSGITITASAKVTVNASTLAISAGMVTVDAGMSKFSGVVQADTVISNSVISSSYTPGAGNIW
ncbi:MAG TPA: phage baseplate assembly protein V [Terriglobia bacterium]|nr:phage baseplate assembly protein V [Terriglobia bacterium]